MAPAASAPVRNSAHADRSHTPVQPPGELAALRARVAELEAQLAARGAQLAAAKARLTVLAEQAGELRRQLDKDSSTSSKPPSSTLRQSDNPDERVECVPVACGGLRRGPI